MQRKKIGFLWFFFAIHKNSVTLRINVNYYVLKGKQIITINTTNLKKNSVYIMQFTIGDKIISKKVNI